MSHQLIVSHHKEYELPTYVKFLMHCYIISVLVAIYGDRMHLSLLMYSSTCSLHIGVQDYCILELSIYSDSCTSETAIQITVFQSFVALLLVSFVLATVGNARLTVSYPMQKEPLMESL